VELYARVRRAVLVEGRSEREVAREFGLAREAVRKMLRYSIPPGYRRKESVRRPKLGPWLGVIDATLEEDKNRPVKQRHTAKRIFDRLRQEYGFTGGYTIGNLIPGGFSASRCSCAIEPSSAPGANIRTPTPSPPKQTSQNSRAYPECYNSAAIPC
jgi:hypothetical protein